MTDEIFERAKAKRATTPFASPHTPEWSLENTDWPEPPPERVMGKILPFRRRKQT